MSKMDYQFGYQSRSFPLYCFYLLTMGFVLASHCHPTIYKYNDNKMLEPDLVPVSSTVIPLPVYKVGYGLHVVPTLKDEKVEKPEGPISLVTVHTKKKASLDEYSAKKFNDGIAGRSSIKEITKKDFRN